MPRLSRSATWILLFAATASSSLAQEPPLVGRPTNFSGLVGRFTLRTTASPTQVLVEAPLVLRVTIEGDNAGQPPTRERLRFFAQEISDVFFVEPRPEDDVADAAAKRWEFVWTLRPKSAEVAEIPSLALSYFSPTIRRYQTARSESIPLRVSPRPPIDEPPPDVPESFLIEATPRPESTNPLNYVLVCGFLALVGSVWGSSMRPRPVSSPAVDAIASLDQHGSEPLIAVRKYLEARFEMTTAEPTPIDVDAALKKHDVPKPVRSRWTAWWRAMDARRFAPVPPRSANAVAEAIDLVRATEGSP